MPAYLSEASKNYHQMRRVRPSDPIEKLEYYLSAESPPHGRLSNPANGRNELAPHSSSAASSSAGSTSSPTSYSSKLVSLIRRRRPENVSIDHASQMLTSGSEMEYIEPATAALAHRRRGSVGVVGGGGGGGGSKMRPTHFSPFQSSGFSEGTLLGPHLDHYQLGPTGGQPLGRRNMGSGKYRYSSSSEAKTVSSHKSVLDEEEAGQGTGTRNQKQVRLLPPSNLDNGGRSRRRKITRINRRMLNKRHAVEADGSFEGYSSSPYALSELFSQSEIPGFREIFASDSYLRKFCWIVAFLFMTVLSLNDMTELITEYYEYPITVDVRLKDTAKLPFPAVTVCNLNVVRFSALCSNSRFELSSQMPSEMRDKLCGIQVEKKKQNNSQTTSDSDISDINNIGITTTTTTTTTTTSTPSTTTSTTASSTTAAAAVVAADTLSSTTQHPGAASPATSTAANDATSSTTVSGEGQKFVQNTRRPQGRRPSGPIWLPPKAPMGPGVARSTRVRRSHDGEKPFAPKKWFLKVVTPKPAETNSYTPVRDRNKASQFNSIRMPNNVMTNQGVSGKPSPAGGGGVMSSGQLPNNRLPPNQPQQVGGPNQFGAPQQPLDAPGQQQPALGPGKPSSSPPSSVVNFMPVSPIEDFELTERQERELQENLTNWLAVMYQRDPQMTRSLGHQFDDMILRCTMKSINCTRQRSFENSFTPTEGNCFTFRSRIKRKVSSNQMTIQWDTFEDANLAGTNDGLELVLNLEKNEYISGSSQVGALVMIHHPSDLGYAASEATFIAPEFTTYIGLKMVNISRLPAPYPEACVDSWPAKFADTLTKNSTYSQQACLKICLQKTIQSHCNCQSAFLPIVELSTSQQQQQQQDATSTTTTMEPISSTAAGASTEAADVISSVLATMAPPSSSFVFGPGGGNLFDQRLGRVNGARGRPAMLKAASSNGSTATTNVDAQGQQLPKQPQQRIIICDTRKRATRQCVREVNLRAADRVHNCECPAKCGVIRYDKTISMARWPTREDKVSFDRGKLDVNFQNLAKVIVYFQTMTCEEVQQQPVFNAAKLFSSLGGIMGMYVGFSFLSVFEIFEVMSRKFWHYLTLRYTNRRFS